MIQLVAFSGGPDSVFLVDFLLKTNKPEELLLVYFNHNLRPQDELRQEIQHIQAFAKHHNLNVIIRKLPVKQTALKEEISLETAARKLRYRMLIHLAHLYKSVVIFTGHHFDDDCETLIQKLIRGTQTHFHGMLPEQVLSHPKGDVLLKRPLLKLSKKQILQTLEEKNLPFSTDSTNADLDIQRNQIRHTIIPQLRALDPQFDSHLQTTLSYLKNLHEFVSHHLKPHVSQIGIKDNLVFLPKKGWGALDPFTKSQLIFSFLETWRNHAAPEAYILEAHVKAVLAGQTKISLPLDWILFQDEHRLRIMKSIEHTK